MSKRIFLAGASGAIGRRLAPLLVANGWLVFGSTRSKDKALGLRKMGVEPVLVDVFDAAELRRLLCEIRPEIVIHQLTDLPYALEASQMTAALVRNARLRDEGTRNLVAAAVEAGAERLIAQSISFIYADGATPHQEADPLLPVTHPVYGETVQGVMSLERQVLEAPLVGIVLRYGLLYGPGTGFDAPIAPGSVHVDAAARAAELAVTAGQSGIFNVAETDGSASSDLAMQTLGWNPGWRADQEAERIMQGRNSSLSDMWIPVTEDWLPPQVRASAQRRAVPVGHRERHSGWLTVHFDSTGHLVDAMHFVGKHSSNQYHVTLDPAKREGHVDGLTSISYYDGRTLTSTPYDGDNDAARGQMRFEEFLRCARLPEGCFARQVPVLFLLEDPSLGETRRLLVPPRDLVDFSWLDRGYTTTDGTGFHATFHPDGRLATLAHRSDYQPDGPQLDLDADGTGWAFRPGSPMRTLVEVHRGGVVEVEGTSKTISFSEWVRSWIARIYETSEGAS